MECFLTTSSFSAVAAAVVAVAAASGAVFVTRFSSFDK
jgi:hypothetical protein